MALDRISRWLGLTDWTETPSGNGKAVAVKSPAFYPTEQKDAGTISFWPRDNQGNVIEMGPVFGSTDRVTHQTAFVVASYAYAAMSWRAEKYSEPPLYVAELTDDDELEWLPDHELADLLDDPHPDLDMGELLYQSRLLRDATGECLWVKDIDNGGRVARLTPFGAHDYTPERTDDRMFGQFRVETSMGQMLLPAERCVFFREQGTSAWCRGIAPLTVALSALRIGKDTERTIRNILRRALFPGGIISPHHEWNPQPQEWEAYRHAVMQYSLDGGEQGKPLVLLGGSQYSKPSWSLKELVPSEVLQHVETVLSHVFRVPAVILQYRVGLENSPWSQMEEARRSATQDLLVPMWTRDGKKLTKQLLYAPSDRGSQPRETIPDRSIEFDLARVNALQPDRKMQAETAAQMLSYAKVSDLRRITGLEPLDDGDERADVIPGLQKATQEMGQPDSTAFANPFADSTPSLDEAASWAGSFDTKSRREKLWQVFDWSIKAATTQWEGPVASELASQGDAISGIVERVLGGNQKRKPEPRRFEQRLIDELLDEIADFIETRSIPRLRGITYPLVFGTASAGVQQAAGQIGTSFRLLQRGLFDYAVRETTFLADVMGTTTGEIVARVVQEGLEAGDTVQKLTKRLRESAAFTRDRAKLVARTETTRAWNGAQQASLSDYSDRTGNGVRKSWLTAQDERVRDEHAAMEGETVGIDAVFSNGLKAPGEPNCRCTCTYELVGA